jgi:hypothetical protein
VPQLLMKPHFGFNSMHTTGPTPQLLVLSLLLGDAAVAEAASMQKDNLPGSSVTSGMRVASPASGLPPLLQPLPPLPLTLSGRHPLAVRSCCRKLALGATGCCGGICCDPSRGASTCCT